VLAVSAAEPNRTSDTIVSMPEPDVGAPIDANGNLTSDGTRTFEWDARNQLVAVTVGAHRSEFTYDGKHRRLRIVEKENSTIISDDRFVWDRDDIVERRDGASGLVTARLYRDALQEDGAARLLTRDQVMSIREVTDASANPQSRYEYAPFGSVTKLAGTGPDFLGFTGMPKHEPSGLILMKRRAYDVGMARWLSKDPIGLQEGPNLYSYVANRPLTWFDPAGTIALSSWGSGRRKPQGQDNKCSQPAGFLNANSCVKKCCQEHDRCFATFGCTQTTWQTFLSPVDVCDLCNWTVVLCILTANPIGQCDTCSK
jgi:RHS repeat-associated protein